jgi:site-specific DNA recombinase
MNASTLRAAGYRRVSMREQVDGHSLAAQSENIQAYAEGQGWKLVKVYTDAGISAKKGSRRPALDDLMADAKAGAFDVVIVDKIDRFYRYLNGLLTALDTLNNWYVSFVSVHEKLDFTTPWGKLTLTVLGMLAEIYIDNLRRETTKGKLQRAKDGYWNGNPPFGYCRGLCSECNNPNGEGYCPDFGKADKSKDDILVPHPIENMVVKRVFKWYLSGDYSDSKIATKLNSSHHQLPNGTQLPLRHRGAPGRTEPGKFSASYVRGVLGRIFYTGKVPYYGVDENGKSRKRMKPKLFPGKHQAIIDDKTFYEVQALREALAPIPRHRCGTRTRVYPLTGMLHCSSCGGRFRGSTGNNGNRYYRDANQVEHVVDCEQPLVQAYAIEKQVVDYLLIAMSSKRLKDKLTSVESLLQQADDRLQRAKILYLAGDIDKDRYDAEKERYEIARESLPFREPGAIIASIHNTRQQLDEWNELQDIKKKRLVRLVLERAYVQGEALVAIQPTYAFAPMLNQDVLGCNCGPDGGRPL